tara:strand:- start:500 stop:838 length:339 start_codon:yes stop_codon:yes gene_type:complete
VTPPTEYDLRLRVGDRKGPYRVLKVEAVEAEFGPTFAFVLQAEGGEIGHFRAVSPSMMRSVFEEQPREGDLVEFTRLNNKPSPFGGSTTGPKVEAVRVLERGGGAPILPSSG